MLLFRPPRPCAALRGSHEEISYRIRDLGCAGILCNVLICLAVWLCMGAQSVTDKILATVFPITAFVVCRFEYSVANMYFLPIGVALAAGTSAPLSVTEAVSNLALVTIGNVLGGTVLVALVYWSVYLRYSD